MRQFLRSVIRRAGNTVHYVRLYLATPRADRYPRAAGLLKSPICWLRGHSWEHGPSFAITPWSAQFCTCCGQEVGDRVSLNQLRSPETDEERDYADWEREREFDLYRDDDGAPYDWDAMRDQASANGMQQ